jgi:hypothetical protein
MIATNGIFIAPTQNPKVKSQNWPIQFELLVYGFGPGIKDL